MEKVQQKPKNESEIQSKLKQYEEKIKFKREKLQKEFQHKQQIFKVNILSVESHNDLKFKALFNDVYQFTLTRKNKLKEMKRKLQDIDIQRNSPQVNEEMKKEYESTLQQERDQNWKSLFSKANYKSEIIDYFPKNLEKTPNQLNMHLLTIQDKVDRVERNTIQQGKLINYHKNMIAKLGRDIVRMKMRNQHLEKEKVQSIFMFANIRDIETYSLRQQKIVDKNWRITEKLHNQMAEMENQVINDLEEQFKENAKDIKQGFNFTSDILIQIEENQRVNENLLAEIQRLTIIERKLNSKCQMSKQILDYIWAIEELKRIFCGPQIDQGQINQYIEKNQYEASGKPRDRSRSPGQKFSNIRTTVAQPSSRSLKKLGSVDLGQAVSSERGTNNTTSGADSSALKRNGDPNANFDMAFQNISSKAATQERQYIISTIAFFYENNPEGPTKLAENISQIFQNQMFHYTSDSEKYKNLLNLKVQKEEQLDSLCECLADIMSQNTYITDQLNNKTSLLDEELRESLDAGIFPREVERYLDTSELSYQQKVIQFKLGKASPYSMPQKEIITTTLNIEKDMFDIRMEQKKFVDDIETNVLFIKSFLVCISEISLRFTQILQSIEDFLVQIYQGEKTKNVKTKQIIKVINQLWSPAQYNNNHANHDRDSSQSSLDQSKSNNSQPPIHHSNSVQIAKKPQLSIKRFSMLLETMQIVTEINNQLKAPDNRQQRTSEIDLIDENIGFQIHFYQKQDYKDMFKSVFRRASAADAKVFVTSVTNSQLVQMFCSREFIIKFLQKMFQKYGSEVGARRCAEDISELDLNAFQIYEKIVKLLFDTYHYSWKRLSEIHYESLIWFRDKHPEFVLKKTDPYEEVPRLTDRDPYIEASRKVLRKYDLMYDENCQFSSSESEDKFEALQNSTQSDVSDVKIWEQGDGDITPSNTTEAKVKMLKSQGTLKVPPGGLLLISDTLADGRVQKKSIISISNSNRSKSQKSQRSFNSTQQMETVHQKKKKLEKMKFEDIVNFIEKEEFSGGLKKYKPNLNLRKTVNQEQIETSSPPAKDTSLYQLYANKDKLSQSQYLEVERISIQKEKELEEQKRIYEQRVIAQSSQNKFEIPEHLRDLVDRLNPEKQPHDQRFKEHVQNRSVITKIDRLDHFQPSHSEEIKDRITFQATALGVELKPKLQTLTHPYTKPNFLYQERKKLAEETLQKLQDKKLNVLTSSTPTLSLQSRRSPAQSLLSFLNNKKNQASPNHSNTYYDRSDGSPFKKMESYSTSINSKILSTRNQTDSDDIGPYSHRNLDLYVKYGVNMEDSLLKTYSNRLSRNRLDTSNSGSPLRFTSNSNITAGQTIRHQQNYSTNYPGSPANDESKSFTSNSFFSGYNQQKKKSSDKRNTSNNYFSRVPTQENQLYVQPHNQPHQMYFQGMSGRKVQSQNNFRLKNTLA